MKNLKLLLPLLALFFLSSSFTIPQQQFKQVKQQKFTPYLLGTFDLEVEFGLLLPISIYGEQINGVFYIDRVEHSNRHTVYPYIGGVSVVSGVITVDMDITIPSGSFYYYGPFD